MHLSQCECTPYYTVNTWVADFMCTVECDKRVCVSQWVYIFCVLIDCCILTPRTSSVGSKSSPSDTESVQTNEHMHGTSTHTHIQIRKRPGAVALFACEQTKLKKYAMFVSTTEEQAECILSIYFYFCYLFCTYSNIPVTPIAVAVTCWPNSSLSTGVQEDTQRAAPILDITQWSFNIPVSL